MFDFIRRHTKWGMAILFLLVIPSFVLWGVGDYTQFNEGARKVAEVDGQAITLTEWDNAHRFEVDRLRASNPSIDLNLLDSPAVKYATLERLVRERVIEVAAADSHLIATDARLAAQLQADPSIAALRRPDGSLDMEAYRRLLATQGLTPEGFEARVRAGMSSDQVLGGVLASSLVSQAQVDVAMNAFQERREARVVRFAPADYAAKLNPSDADLQAFYQANTARYQAPETARVEYLVLDIDSVKKTVDVSEDDLRAYYKQNAATLGTPEERRASHILITAPKDAPAAEREKAKAQATALLAELRQAPDSFAEVARKSSQDDTSASGGGDLGWFQKDRGIDPAISKATYALAKAGDISEVIESDFGYHIVRVTEIKPAAVPPFEELRPKLEDQLRTQLAQKEFGELAEIFTNGVYEQSDSLQPTAERLKLSVQSADGVMRTPAPGASGPLANAKFLSALFSSDALDKKRNTEALEFGASQLVSGRVVQHNPAHARPFDEVKSDVRTAFTSQRGAEMARQEGAQRLKAWIDQPASASKLPDALTLSRDEPAGQPPQLVEAVLRVDPAKLPSFVGVDLGADGYVIARVDKVLPQAEPKPEQAVQSRDRYEELWLMAEARRYYDFLRDRYKARILEPAPAAPEAAAAK
jgi:peptidyl-prolyl cis-trans isomerase D